MIKLILADVDGTLIPLGKDRASERTMQAIRHVEEAGMRFGLATGRDTVELNRLFGYDDRAIRTGILSNGKRIMVDGHLAQLTLLDNGALQRAADVVTSYPDTFMTAYPLHTDGTNTIYCIGTTEQELEAWMETYAFSGILAPRVPEEDIIGATIATNAPEELLDKLRDSVLAACPEFDLAKPALRWWDLLPKGLNKGTALQLLLDKLGLGSDEVVFFGDADNDLALLLAVENSVAVSNATPAAQAAAKWHIGSCDDDAVAEALEELVRASKDGSTPAFMRA